MTKNTVKNKLKYLACFIVVSFLSLLFCPNSCFAALGQQGLSDSQREMFNSNKIWAYNPGECLGRADATSCFRVDTNTSAMDSWYAEGCIDNGQCTSGIYAAGTGVAFTNSSSPNHFLMSDTKVDPDLGGLQYIYAENYDIEFDAYNGWIATFTPNGGNSQTKYYWIVLPDKAYTTAFGETYVATFENSTEPIYFIVYDAHACQDQGQHYCEKAESDPDGVAIGPEFLGAFSQEGGNYTEAAKKLGKLKSFCRIKGKGPVLAKENGTGSASSGSSSGSSSSSPSSTSGTSGSDPKSDVKEKCAKLGELRKEMWDKASQEDKESFMKTVSEEVHDIAGVEIYMNQIIAKHGSDGTLHNWLTGQCEKYRPSSASCTGSHKITEEEQKWIDEALDGSNNVKFAIGNATGGSSVGAGKIVCVWDGKKCREDVDYTKEGGKGSCSVYSSSASFGECLGMEGKDDWAKDIEKSCGSNCNSFEGDYPQYYQGNYSESDHENSKHDWTGDSYDGGTMSNSGCGPTSAAMLATVASGQDIYPDDVARVTGPGNYVDDGGVALDEKLGAEYGFEVKTETPSSKEQAVSMMKDYLDKGYMIHTSGCGITYSPTGNCHYVGIFELKDDQAFLADSSGRSNRWVNFEEFILSGYHLSFTAIKGGKGGGACFNYCNGDTSVGEEGLTVEQAKTFMMNYGANKNDSSAKAVGDLWNFCNGGGSNCVTFSAFFMYKFTNIPNKGATGNGNEVVDTVVGWNVGATRGTDPKVWAIISTDPIHTAVVLGHHDGKWIIGHASCSYGGRGKGNGGDGHLNSDPDSKGGGSGYIAIEESDDPGQWQWMNPGVRFAYPSEVYVDKIEEYLESGV